MYQLMIFNELISYKYVILKYFHGVSASEENASPKYPEPRRFSSFNEPVPFCIIVLHRC